MIKDLTQKEYRQHEGISRSDLMKFKKSPLHYKFSTETEANTTPALLFGAACHKWLLEEDDFWNEFTVAPICDRRTKEGKQIWADFVNANANREIISNEDFEVIKAMKEAVLNHPIASQLIGGEHEVSLFWRDGDTGEMCKVRPDIMTEYKGAKLIVDYKTTDSCQDGHFERSARKYGYKMQSGMYREGYFCNFYEDAGFAFIAQEKEAPYAVRVYFCTEEYLSEGYDEYRALLGLYHECRVNNNYPGYEEIEYLYGEES